MFFETFKRMRFDRQLGFSTKVSTEVATNLTIGLMQPMYSQIDPVRLGELQRFVRISLEYGERLATSNVQKGTIEKLVVGYPSHGFIIDRSEARQLFQRVSKPSDALEVIGHMELARALEAGAFEHEGSQPVIDYINDELSSSSEEADGDGKPVKATRKRKTSRKRPSSKARSERNVAQKPNGAG